MAEVNSQSGTLERFWAWGMWYTGTVACVAYALFSPELLLDQFLASAAEQQNEGRLSTLI
jgi:hypothetical protein